MNNSSRIAPEVAKHPLSSRLRPNSEAAPWVIEEIKKLESRLAEANDAVGKPSSVVLTVGQIASIAKFYADSDEEDDSEKCIYQMPQWTCTETGEVQPAGIYVSDEEYPEHGLLGPFDGQSAVLSPQSELYPYGLRREAVDFAISTLEIAVENATELLAQHDSSFGRTTRKNKLRAEALERDLEAAKKALAMLRAEPSKKQ